MPDSPISATPYEVLGVSSTASQDDLRRAYRRLMRETHPDTGGDAARFTSVQVAWERVGDPEERAAYDRGRPASRGDDTASTWAPQSRPKQADTRPRARSYGHPGGWRRERYLLLMREWVGRGEPLEDPYAPSLVRSAPMDLRHLLADALEALANGGHPTPGPQFGRRASCPEGGPTSLKAMVDANHDYRGEWA